MCRVWLGRGGEYGEVCLNGRHITSSTAVSVLGAELRVLDLSSQPGSAGGPEVGNSCCQTSAKPSGHFSLSLARSLCCGSFPPS